MKFPQYWSRATAEETRPDGERVAFSCWRWSDNNRDEAQASAFEAARRVVRKLIAGEPLGRYGYGHAPLREEVLQRFANDEGQTIAAITQNAWGALVLNTSGAMFIDVDFPEVGAGEQVRHFFGRWFDKQAVAPDVRRESQACARLEVFVRDHPDWQLRVYRTCAGLRALATHALFDPAAAASQQVFDAVGADPTYVRLCRQQASFRARLTPKPWRCGHTVNGIRWPRESEDQQAAFAAWQQAYVDKQAGFATCRYLETLGGGAVHPDVARIVEVHDQVARAGESLPLA